MTRECFCNNYVREFEFAKSKCFTCWLWFQNEQLKKLHSDTHDSFRPKKIPCVHLGKEVNGQSRERLGLTHLKVWRECEMGRGPQCQCNANCGPVCPDYKASGDTEESLPFRFSQEKGYPSVGISIGSYGMPDVIELQAKVIRANCGDIPILISDDHTEEAGDDGHAKKMKLLDVCEQYGLIYRDTAPFRVGHAGGDLGSFFHGLSYAAANSIEYWLKLSQRFIVDRPLFVQKLAAMMKERDAHTMSQTHKNRGQFFFAMRTEFVLMNVPLWSRPDILAQLQPRPLGRAAEDIVYRCCQRFGGAFMASPLFTDERSKPHKDLLWYEADGAEGYHRMAAKYGVPLESGFHAGGSVHSPGFRWG